MKFLDKVRLIRNRKEYEKYGISVGMVGTISQAEIRDNYFEVIFIDERNYDKEFMSIEGNVFKLNDDIISEIRIEDLELVEDSQCSDEWILQSIPKNNPNWWCKVEDGYITNLKGEKKNKIPYDYNS